MTKLILANNHSQAFEDFYGQLAKKSVTGLQYGAYKSLLFKYDYQAEQPISVIDVVSGASLADYAAVYINGYLKTYELAASVAIACQSLGIPFVNQELQNPPSMSKLSMYGKLGAAGVPIPRSLAGTKFALLHGIDELTINYPAVLKRADADRGIDNYKVTSLEHVQSLLNSHDDMTVWILQDYIPNDGFYLLTFYGYDAAFCIFRSLETRPDGDDSKAHMYKPKGGTNAQLIGLSDVPPQLVDIAQRAAKAMNRQIASVDCIYNASTEGVSVLEVNYNPQLATITTFQDVRTDAFQSYIDKLGEH